MKVISRRSFIKTACAGITLLMVKKANLPVPNDKEPVTLRVDEDGNAILHGVELRTDFAGNARIKEKRVI